MILIDRYRTECGEKQSFLHFLCNFFLFRLLVLMCTVAKAKRINPKVLIFEIEPTAISISMNSKPDENIFYIMIKIR